MLFFVLIISGNISNPIYIVELRKQASSKVVLFIAFNTAILVRRRYIIFSHYFIPRQYIMIIISHLCIWANMGSIKVDISGVASIDTNIISQA